MGHKHSDEFRSEAVRIALTSGLTGVKPYHFSPRLEHSAHGVVTLTRLLRKNARRRRVSRRSSYDVPPAHRLSSELAKRSS
jgi:hypothetical protein